MPHDHHTTILLAPAAAGKTEAALAGMAKPRRGQTVLLVPSGFHRDRLAPQVAARIPRASVYQMSRLVTHILKEAGIELPQASPTLRIRLLRAELIRLAAEGAIPHLAPVAHKPGLVTKALSLIDELQAAQTPPEALATADVSSYDADLSAIYAAYQSALARIGVSDDAGRMARAIAVIQSDDALLANLAFFVVDGFDQFTSLQLRLLRSLCERAEQSLITLTGDPGERPAHRRFTATLDALRLTLPWATVEYLPRTISPLPPLAHAEATIFELDIHTQVDAAGAIHLISAPDREREVRAALRHVRTLLADNVAPENIAVIFRDSKPYASLLREIAAEYELPLAIAAGRPLAEAPPIISLLAMLSLPVTSSLHPALATAEEYVSWLNKLPGLLPLAPNQSDCLHRLLAELADASRLLNEPPQLFGDFLADLRAAVDAASYDHQSPRPGSVAALDALAARSSCFPHVVLMGLAEGEFPARLPAPAFYTRRERAILFARGVPLPAADPADERTLFYEAITRARCSLTLCFTRLDESGNPLQPSAYLRDLLSRFTKGSIPTHTLSAGSAPTLAEAASSQEHLIALMDSVAGSREPGAGSRPPATCLRPPASGPQPPDLYAHVTHACAVERDREGTESYGPYEGVLTDQAVIAALAVRFGPAHPWSVTQINDYTTCPFRFAAAHLLRLTPAGDTEEGMTQIDRGRLIHAILAHAGCLWAARHLPAAAAHEDAYLADLSAAADEVLANAPQTYGFNPGPFWNWEQAELRSTLARAIRRSLRDGGGWDQYVPILTEESFGLGDGRHALHLDTAAGPARIIGRIDRIDRAADGTLALIDYKSGSTPRSLEETLDGRDVQLTVYTLAAEQFLAAAEQTVARAGYLYIGSGKRGKPLTPAKHDEAKASLRNRLGDAVMGAQTGQFPVRPRDDCPSYCAFVGICRRNLAKRALDKVSGARCQRDSS